MATCDKCGGNLINDGFSYECDDCDYVEVFPEPEDDFDSLDDELNELHSHYNYCTSCGSEFIDDECVNEDCEMEGMQLYCPCCGKHCIEDGECEETCPCRQFEER